MLNASKFKDFKVSCVQPSRGNVLPLISLIPNPTSEAHEFYVLHVLYKYLATCLQAKQTSKLGLEA